MITSLISRPTSRTIWTPWTTTLQVRCTRTCMLVVYIDVQGAAASSRGPGLVAAYCRPCCRTALLLMSIVSVKLVITASCCAAVVYSAVMCLCYCQYLAMCSPSSVPPGFTTVMSSANKSPGSSNASSNTPLSLTDSCRGQVWYKTACMYSVMVSGTYTMKALDRLLQALSTGKVSCDLVCESAQAEVLTEEIMKLGSNICRRGLVPFKHTTRCCWMWPVPLQMLLLGMATGHQLLCFGGVLLLHCTALVPTKVTMYSSKTRS